MNIMEINPESVNDGEGLRVVIFVSGCSIGCKGCHNPQSHDFNNGIPFTEETMTKILELLDKPYISGLTLSGGHPLEPQNLPAVYNIVKRVKEKFPDKSIWIYSGMTMSQIKEKDKFYEEHEINSPSPLDVIKYCDILVDGKYVDELRDITLPFRGSSNQRVIDIKKTLEKGDIILWEN